LRAGGIRQTAKAPVNLRIFGGFAIHVDGGVDGFLLYPHETENLYGWQDHARYFLLKFFAYFY